MYGGVGGILTILLKEIESANLKFLQFLKPNNWSNVKCFTQTNNSGT